MKQKYLHIFFFIFIIIINLILGRRLFEYYKEDQNLTEIQSLIKVENEEKIKEIKKTENFKEMHPTYITEDDFIDFSDLKKANNDVVGLIRIKGTKINYPVLRTDDAKYYLNRDLNKKHSIYGSIYIDPASSTKSTNIVMYGHNMRSGKMFGELDLFNNPNFCKTAIIKFITEDEIKVYKVADVFSGTVTEKLSKNLIPYTQEEYKNLKDYIENDIKATKYSDILWGQQLITLVTCEYTHKDGHTFVIGSLVESYVRKK